MTSNYIAPDKSVMGSWVVLDKSKPDKDDPEQYTVVSIHITRKEARETAKRLNNDRQL